MRLQQVETVPCKATDSSPEMHLRLRLVKPFGLQGRGESGLARPAGSDNGTLLGELGDALDELIGELGMRQCLCLFHQRLPMRLDLLGILVHQRVRNGLFIRKVVVQRADRRPASLRDRRHSRCFVADFDKDPRGRVQNTRQPARRAFLLR